MGKSFLLLQTVTIFNRFKTKPNGTYKDSFKHDYIPVVFPPSPSFSICEQSPWFSSHSQDINFPTGTGFSNAAISLPHISVSCPTFPLESRHGHFPLLPGITATSEVTSTLSNPQCPKVPFSFRGSDHAMLLFGTWQ